MNDKDLSDKIRKLAARFRQQMEPHTPAAECAVWKCAAEAVESLLAPPTLADMTDEERAACDWMRADVDGIAGDWLIVDPFDDEDHAHVIGRRGNKRILLAHYITPRPNLPRMEWTGNKKPAPALPGDWRVADHKVNGRVTVTSPVPTRDGRVYYVLPSDDPLGFDWLSCPPDELTYLDTED